MASEDIQNLLRSGIEAARDGNPEVARALLEQVVTLDTRNEVAWMWLASVLDSGEERQRALRRVLSINPDNERAQQALRKLQTGTLRPIEEVDLERGSYTPPPLPPMPPPDLSATSQSRTRRRMNARQQLALVAAILMIIAAVILALGESSTDDEGDAALVAGASITPTRTASPTSTITFTPRPTNTVAPDTIIVTDLPGEWTPAPDAPSTPTIEPTPWPDTRQSLEIIFSGADEASDPAELLTVRADAESPPRSLPVTLSSSDDEAATFSEIELLDPAYSPNGRMLAFTVQIAPDVQEIFVLALDNNALRQLTDLGGSITDGAAWSADGERLAFSSNAPSTTGATIFDIYEADVDSGNLTPLTEGNARNREPAWSPDGRFLVFSSDIDTPGEREIWSINLSASDRTPQKLTDATNSSFAPGFSPDSRHIAFISNRRGDNDLYVMNADGTDERLISVDDNGIDERDPAWSPDGNWILLSTNRSGGPTLQLWLVRPDGSEWTPVTDGDGDNRAGYWLPIN